MKDKKSKTLKTISLQGKEIELWDLLENKTGFVRMALRKFAADSETAGMFFTYPARARKIIEDMEQEYYEAKTQQQKYADDDLEVDEDTEETSVKTTKEIKEIKEVKKPVNKPSKKGSGTVKYDWFTKGI